MTDQAVRTDAAAEVLCIGEAMITLTPEDGAVDDADSLRMFPAGAEANVAATMAALGGTVEWFGRLGDDPFARRILRYLGGRGVSTGHVTVDRTRPTGMYVKDRSGDRSTMYYYRAGSAASAMSTDDLPALRLTERALVHVSGITAALSPSCGEAVAAILDTPGIAVSFDVNFRAKLWPVEQAAPQLLALARRATVVLVGRDEAEDLWGTATPAAIRTLLSEVPTLVVKDAENGATEYSDAGETFVPAPALTVVEPIGAGDAFAAGYLTAWLAGAAAEERLKWGHVLAGHALSQAGDSPTTLPSLDAITAAARRTGTAWRDVFGANA